MKFYQRTEQNRGTSATIFEHKNEQNAIRGDRILPVDTDKISTKKDNIDEKILGSPPQNFCNPKCKNAMRGHRILFIFMLKNSGSPARIFYKESIKIL